MQEVNLGETDFDDYKWLSYQQAMDLAEKIYFKGKKRITVGVLEIIKELELL